MIAGERRITIPAKSAPAETWIGSAQIQI